MNRLRTSCELDAHGCGSVCSSNIFRSGLRGEETLSLNFFCSGLRGEETLSKVVEVVSACRSKVVVVTTTSIGMPFAFARRFFASRQAWSRTGAAQTLAFGNS
jgi:hypothetical protein